MHLLTDLNAWAALLTLTALEVVLGIDNIVFIGILTARCSRREAKKARVIGLSLAFIFRVLLLASLSWIMDLTEPVFTLRGFALSWRDVILLAGGLFLIAKATHEIHNEVEANDHGPGRGKAAQTLLSVTIQLAVIDLVFSIDSIVTAVGLADDLEVMIAAVVIAMVVMYFASGPVGKFIATYPTTKMLALSFLLLIGVALMADGFHLHIPRGYIYSAMAFAAAVEMFNVMAGRNRSKRAKARR
jgi:predicted tellurium resistance membrane protein TerC